MNEPTQTKQWEIPHYGDVIGFEEFLYESDIFAVRNDDDHYVVDVMMDAKGYFRTFAEALEVVSRIVKVSAQDIAANEATHDDLVIVQTVVANCLQQLHARAASSNRWLLTA